MYLYKCMYTFLYIYVYIHIQGRKKLDLLQRESLFFNKEVNCASNTSSHVFV